jgi:hypothetical protein
VTHRDRKSVVSQIAALGVDEVGRMYAAREVDDDLRMAVFLGVDEHGEPLPVGNWWRLILAAVDACPNDDEAMLWSLGDGAIDHIRGRDGTMSEQVLAARGDHPKLMRVFEVMRAGLPAEGVTTGFWFE